jgi:NAD-dependent deacetylase
MDTCRRAAPNGGHLALVEMERLLGDRFALITQNVDGLHLRAGNSPERTYHIHGNVFFMRCAAPCTAEVFPLPEGLPGKHRDEPLTETEKQRLRCPACRGWARPHVLWFDETYNETHFKLESSLAAAARTDLLIVVGTAGATNLPNQVAWVVKQRGGAIVDVNIERNVFSDLALSGGAGFFVQAESGTALPEMVDIMSNTPE